MDINGYQLTIEANMTDIAVELVNYTIFDINITFYDVIFSYFYFNGEHDLYKYFVI